MELKGEPLTGAGHASGKENKTTPPAVAVSLHAR
jgi:hypothetical protein